MPPKYKVKHEKPKEVCEINVCDSCGVELANGEAYVKIRAKIYCMSCYFEKELE
jgi:hypothetical protein